jgi:spore coat protein H
MKRFFYYIVIIVVLCVSCYKEYTYEDVIVGPCPCDDNQSDTAFVFDIHVTGEQLSTIHTTHSRIEITNPDPAVYLNNDELMVDRLSIRGESSLNFWRKSFTLNLDQILTIIDSTENTTVSLSRMKLLAQVFDYTYIENRIAFAIYKKLGLWPLYTRYAQVRINNEHQGLYLLIEDPEEYYLHKLHSGFIMRRGYHNAIDNYEYEPLNARFSSDHYQQMFYKIYEYILAYSGNQLYDSLSSVMNVERYMKKLAVDYLLKNGDYTDEVFFYADENDPNSRLQAVPWDYDDLFSSQPHEIGRNWGPGTLFGTRLYASMDDVRADVGDKLIYSIEDDLDYIFAKDEYLYNIYLEILRKVIEMIDDNTLNEICDEVTKKITPFYSIQAVSDLSKYDVDETSWEKFVLNMEDKRGFLLNRRLEIINKLNNVN